MAGIYLHIPFCKKACFYCDFHFTVSFKSRDDIVAALHAELSQRKNLVQNEEIETIYFGGGTPSVLTGRELRSLLSTIYKTYKVKSDAEITLEANPDDLTFDYLKELFEAGINRLSIGIQSFDDSHLKWMNRSHTNEQSVRCIKEAADVGFKDISIDLIYGLPHLGVDQWTNTVNKAMLLPINHLSAYSLTMEQQTPYEKLVKQKKYQKPDNELAAEHFAILVRQISTFGWQQYEVSNFCKNENYSKHNTSYWQNKTYLGVGPSAHSFDGVTRSWNLKSNSLYLEKIAANIPAYEEEVLSNVDKINEYLLTGLRTKWGIDLKFLAHHGYDLQLTYNSEITKWKEEGWVHIFDDKLVLTTQGFLFADYIASQLFYVD